MIVSFFKSNRLVYSIIIPIIIFVLWVHVFFKDNYIDESCTSPLFCGFAELIGSYRWLSILISVILISIQALLINRIVLNHGLLSEKSYIPAIVYVVLTSSLPSFFILNPVLFYNIILLVCINEISKVYLNEDNKAKIFNTGFLLAFGSMLIPAFSIYLIIIWAALIILRQFVWREWVIAIIGFVIPFAFVYLFVLAFDYKGLIYLSDFMNFDFNTKLFFSIKWQYLVIIAFITLYLLISISVIGPAMNKRKVVVRKLYSFFVWIILIGLFCNLIIVDWKIHYLAVLVIPLTIIISNYFHSIRRNKVAEVMLYCLISVIVVFGYIL